MGRFRDAITGLFTTKQHAEAHPDTTVREAVTELGPVRVLGKRATAYCNECGALWQKIGPGELDWYIVSTRGSGRCCGGMTTDTLRKLPGEPLERN